MNRAFQWTIGVVTLLPALIAGGRPAYAQSTPAAKSTADRKVIKIAEPFTWTLSVAAATGTIVHFPELTDSIGPFEVISTKDRFDVPEDAGRSWTRVYRLESFEPGSHEIPPVMIKLGERTLETKPVSIEVQSVLNPVEDPLKFRDLKDVMDLPAENANRNWALWIAAATVAMVAIAIFTIVLTRKKTVSPDAWACGRLEELRQTEAFTSGEQVKLLPAVADVLREYIGRRFAISAPQQTTSEFLTHIQSDPRLDENQRQELRNVLSQADEIKFASGTADNDRLDSTFNHARRFVEATTKQQAARDRESRRHRRGSPKERTSPTS